MKSPYIIIKEDSPKQRSVIIVITSRGKAYYASWAGNAPSQEEAMKEWKENRRNFLPYFGQYGW